MAGPTKPGMISGMSPLAVVTGNELMEVSSRQPDGSWKTFSILINKIRTNQGLSAYEVAVVNGFTGTQEEWLTSLEGQSAYGLAVDLGFTGTEQEWLASTVGPSAYSSAVKNGFTGTEAEWLKSLEGKSIYQIAVDNGFVGTEAQWLAQADAYAQAAKASADAAEESLNLTGNDVNAANQAKNSAVVAKDAAEGFASDAATSSDESLTARDSSEAFAINAAASLATTQGLELQAQLSANKAEEVVDDLLTDLADPAKGAKKVAFGGDQPTVDAALLTRAKGNPGKTYNLIGAAVRRDTLIAPNWQLVSDTAHIPVNMSEPTDGVELQLNYVGSKIGALVVGSDERLAAAGVLAGGSVGADKAYLRMGAPCSYTVNMTTSEIIYDARFYRLARFGISIAPSGLITLTHPQRQLNLMPLIQYFSDDSSVELMFPFDIRTNGVSLTTLYIKRRMAGRINYNGAVWAASNSPFNSDITFAYDVPTGVLTVTHPQITGNVQPNVTPYSGAADEYFVSVFNSTGTGFQVKFRKVTDGSIPVGTPTGMGFYFDRGISAIDKVPSGKLHVHLGHVQVDMRDVDFPLANIWPLALMEA